MRRGVVLGGRCRLGGAPPQEGMLLMRHTWTAAVIAALAVPLAACQSKGPRASGAPGGATRAEGTASCPATRTAADRLPGVDEEHLSADAWLAVLGERHDLDEVLLSPADVRALNAAMEVPRERFHTQRDLLAPVDAAEVERQIRERFAWLRDKLESGAYVSMTPFVDVLRAPDQLAIEPELRVALEVVQLYCAPSRDALRDAGSTDVRLDANRCSAAHPQELVQVLAPWPGDSLLVRTAHSWGFVDADAPLSPPVPEALAPRFSRGPFASVGDAGLDAGDLRLPPRAKIPLADDPATAHVATTSGFATVATPAAAVTSTERPLTRRALIEGAFSYLDAPYGFGGADGGIDCSRFLLDLFGSFGIRLPRHSGWQAKAGSFSVDVGDVGDAETLRLLDAAAERGAVLLHMPGHIMLYLGRDRDGTPMAIHAFSHYLETCEGGGETAVQLDRVQVSDLELGRGTSKTSFLERIDRIVVLGKPPGVALAGAASLRPVAPIAQPTASACRQAPGGRLFVSPERPHQGAPLRVVATSARDTGPATIALFDPSGERHLPEVVETGGPPFGFIAEIENPARGRWTAVLGDGDTVHACRTVQVHARPKAVASDAAGPIWPVRRAWTPALEDLYAVFVERLFDYPVDEDVSWSSLHEVVRDTERNILLGHLGHDGEDAFDMVPDCADLPYTLRAYFAWKLGLPFGMHECPRAREGRPPRCKRGGDNLLSRAELGQSGDVGAFDRFVNREVRRMVHSSSGRTAPNAGASDFYPVPLTREALRPGTLFTDPYGHLIVVVDWVPQGLRGSGALIGADAQPDGTVGLRRFWRGSFLFRPETDSGGAGFKAFRPWVHDESSGTLVLPGNDELRDRPDLPFSRQQYEGSVSDFYDRMQALINPRPLDPEARLTSLIDALEEQVVRRVTSVRNGEDFMRERGFRTIDMPRGSSIFLTTGPWEDFATPSRDWRLLIAIDTVAEFPDAVLRAPEQYGIDPSRAEEAVAELREVLEAELDRRPLTYTRSDGSTWQLTLKDVVDRRDALEMAYNPNDCIETRWAAPEGSDERSTCERHAPADQRARMDEYRPWFTERRRPPT